jgi:hypothetical protein
VLRLNDNKIRGNLPEGSEHVCHWYFCKLTAVRLTQDSGNCRICESCNCRTTNLLGCLAI